MQIEQEGYFVLLLDVDNVILNCFDLREKLQVRRMKIAIKILPQHSSSVISEENAIRVDHRHNIKVKMFSQDWRF